jgi:hypothetical protein
MSPPPTENFGSSAIDRCPGLSQAANIPAAVARVTAWADTRAAINPARAHPVCLSIAEPVPGLDTGAVVTATKMALWAFAVDDAVDEGKLAPGQLPGLFAGFGAIARGEPGAPVAAAGALACSLRDTLLEVCADLAAFDLFAPLRPTWARAVERFLDAGLLEEQWRQEYLEAGTLPRYDRYLANGAASIAVPPCLWAVLIAAGDPCVLDHVAGFDRLIDQAGLCCRLSNDLRSYLKELHEGNVNAVVLHMAGGVRDGQAPEEALACARRRIEAEIGTALADCEAMASGLGTQTGSAQRSVYAFALWICSMYQRTGVLGYRPGGEETDQGWTSRES